MVSECPISLTLLGLPGDLVCGALGCSGEGSFLSLRVSP